MVKNDTLLLREAKKLSQQESQGINQMLEQVRKGNNNPGVGTKVFNGITEFRHANGGRLYARKSGSSWEILGYSGKGNQSTVINRLITLYGK
ncbi:hemagglutinin [Psychrobacter sp. M13]|uniref:hemagglutinin n=1 Tax=Psychrobacter sp. M13 TaxID=3067275 RepID=UPI00273BE3B4|nr:hemagglutinin [Psychrobacter sp. M13]WLP94200.1 hemagglutinin [Psychrobacter sp. M13]